MGTRHTLLKKIEKSGITPFERKDNVKYFAFQNFRLGLGKVKKQVLRQ